MKGVFEMREEINELDLEKVAGGSVNLSEKKNKIGFDTIGEVYTLKCPFKDARTLVSGLFATNQDKTEKEFDILVRDEFKAKGWI